MLWLQQHYSKNFQLQANKVDKFDNLSDMVLIKENVIVSGLSSVMYCSGTQQECARGQGHRILCKRQTLSLRSSSLKHKENGMDL